MVADFRQFYGVDLPVGDDEGGWPDLARAALLWRSLPPESRCARRMSPSLRWTQTDYLLRAVEHDLRVLIWTRTRDGEKGRRFPEPIRTPAERADAERRRDSALSERGEIDRILGMTTE